MLCCLREWLASRPARSASRIRVSCGNGYPAADSVETSRGNHLWHGQIGVGPTVQTRFVATPGGHASWALGYAAPHGVPHGGHRQRRRCAGRAQCVRDSRELESPEVRGLRGGGRGIEEGHARSRAGLGIVARGGMGGLFVAGFRLDPSSLRGPHAVHGWI